MLVTVATFQPRMSPYFVLAVVGFVVHCDTAELMLPLVMAVSWATAMGENSSSSCIAATAQTDEEAAATCIAHRLVPRGSLARAAVSLTRRVQKGEGRSAASFHTWAGLRTPKRRVERRGAAIEVESESNVFKGAVFFFAGPADGG